MSAGDVSYCPSNISRIKSTWGQIGRGSIRRMESQNLAHARHWRLCVVRGHWPIEVYIPFDCLRIFLPPECITVEPRILKIDSLSAARSSLARNAKQDDTGHADYRAPDKSAGGLPLLLFVVVSHFQRTSNGRDL